MVTSHAERRQLKGEDAYAAVVDDVLMKGCYGVFDSHGGKAAGEICAKELTEKLMALNQTPRSGSAAFATPAISSEFWAIDKRLGVDGIMSGTTASVLLVSASDSLQGTVLSCKLAWVGDSTSCVVNMNSAEDGPVQQTHDHNPSSACEIERMELEWQVRAELTECMHHHIIMASL